MMAGLDAAVLEAQRLAIDDVDRQIVALLARRMDVVAEVVTLKRRHGLDARLPDRVEEVIAKVRAQAASTACPPDLAEAVWRTVIAWTIAHEEERLAGANPAP